MLKAQKIDGLIFEKPSVVFKNPLDAIPVMIAITKYIYPEIKLIVFIKPLQIDRRPYISTAIFSLILEHLLD